MINQLLKLGLFITLGAWLKNRGKGLALLTLTLFLAWFLHNEYLSYLSQSGDDAFLAVSFVIKWGVFLIATLVYYFKVERKLNKKPQANHNTIQTPITSSETGDGFDFLRRKKTLESAEDKILNKPPR